MKFRLTVTEIREYEVHPQNYPAGATIEEMLAIDKASISDDPNVMLDHPDTTTTIELVHVKGS